MRLYKISKVVKLTIFFLFFVLARVIAADFSESNSLSHNESQQQGIVVTGTVVDKMGPLTGVSIVIKGTTRGVVTDIDGKFTITVLDKESVLQFFFIGYVTQEIVVGDSKNLNITMSESAANLDEVIVVGYGTQRKQSVVGAISLVKSEELMRTGGVTNISNALTGLVPGLTTLNYSGKPGSDAAEIIIRSKSTWNGSDPLILVDGVERNMNDIDINEVENISVLKDASATAVFGVRGGNGVILVTTKRGKEGKPVLSVSASVTAKTLSKIPQFLNSYNALLLRNQAIENQLGPSPASHWSSYITPVDVLRRYRDQTDPEIYPDVDWQDEMLHQWSWSQHYNMGLQGATKFVKYYASLSYTYDGDILKGQDFGQGYVPKNDYSRYNFRLNLDFQPTTTTTFGVNLDGAQGIENTTNATPAYLWLGVYGKGPDQYPVRYSDGTFANNAAGYNMYNPVEYFNFSGIVKEVRTDMNTNFTLNQKLDFIAKGLSIKGLVNFRNYYISNGPNVGANRPVTKYIDWRTGVTTWNIPVSDKTGFEYVPVLPQVTTETIKNASNGTVQLYKNLMYQLNLNYSRVFGNHKIGATGVFKRTDNSLGQTFPTYREEWAGRVTYDYAGCYLLEGNAGYNGSEKFGKGKKFGFFPAVAFGWMVSEELFFKKSKLNDYVNLFKLRYSWGKVGSDNGIPRWLYVTQWSSINNSAWLGTPIQSNSFYPGHKISVIGNPEARWETSVKNDLAAEMSFLKNHLTASIDYYWEYRYDIFLPAEMRNIPDWFGADPVPSNLGRTSANGWEVEARWNSNIGSDFKYYVAVMYSNSQDRIDYIEDPELIPAYQKLAGYPIGQQHAYIDKGPITNWDEMYTGVKGTKEPNNFIPGMLQLVDYNGDGVVDENDLVPYGYSNHPLHTMNLTAGVEWKNLSFMIQFYGSTGITLQQSEYLFTGPHYYSVVDKSIVSDLWLPAANPGGNYRAPVYNLGGDVNNTGTYNMVDGTMWRLKNIEIAYRFGGTYIKKLGINGLRVYLNGNDLWLFSYLNEDRETGGTRANDNIQKYPMTKRFNIGVNIEF
ncbi:MAG: TonB-dependent receptor [Dysgonamonadaceae bacterium]|jgi:TonB-linked SusC/RagA family outer membrane protein|nr:TonB-dependent receptor [Dysgonamonadaceae bacterium]